MVEVQELQKRVNELESRLERLEKIENKRQTTKLIKLLIKVIILIAVLVAFWVGYNHVNETYIKPYKKTVDEIKETYDNVKNTSISLDSIIGKKKG